MKNETSQEKEIKRQERNRQIWANRRDRWAAWKKQQKEKKDSCK